MLDAFIIKEIERQEEERERQRDRNRPRQELPVPPPAPSRRDEEKSDRGVAIIDYSVPAYGRARQNYGFQIDYSSLR